VEAYFLLVNEFKMAWFNENGQARSLSGFALLDGKIRKNTVFEYFYLTNSERSS
jgi:hypothetical protein